MSLSRYVRITLTIVVGVAVASLVVGGILGQPVLLSYVTTGSMEPTLNPGDGFVAVPVELTDELEPGDVVVFEAETIQGGGLTTHRIVGETDRGFITRGDANPVADQDSDEPPVQRERIVAVAWQPQGEVLVIPAVGTVAEASQRTIQAIQIRLAELFNTRALVGAEGYALMFSALAFVGFLFDWFVGGSRPRERDTSRATGTNTRLLLAVIAVGLAVTATIAMVGPAGTEEYQIISAEFESDRPLVIEQGDATTVTYAAGNSGFIPVVVFLEPGSNRVDVNPQELRIERRAVANASVTLSAPPETGLYRRYVTEHRYLAVLPYSTIRALYDIHPWLPIVVIDLLIAVPTYLVGARLVGTGRIRSRSRDSPSLTRRLRDRYL